MNSNFGIYVHIPFCIQRCTYCDFATYSKDQIAANDQYVEILCTEIEKRQNLYTEKQVDTIYFGGGTPSLLHPYQIDKILRQIKIVSAPWAKDIEITMEVNPATLNQDKLESFLEAGINRMSIGCQTFDDQALSDCNREHNSNDTVQTIELVKKYLPNYSLDLLFSLPKQGLKKLESDVNRILSFSPPHVSAYCLTVPEKHPMNKGRCSEEEQLAMFDHIYSEFEKQGLHAYEISNFAKEGFHSKHNTLYWTDSNYWGVGLSAHSYQKEPHWGNRFWNPSSYDGYLKQIKSLDEQVALEHSFPNTQRESLSVEESLTDFCHTHLRLSQGLNVDLVRHKFGDAWSLKVQKKINKLISQELLEKTGPVAKLSKKGIYISNLVFSEFLFTVGSS